MPLLPIFSDLTLQPASFLSQYLPSSLDGYIPTAYARQVGSHSDVIFALFHHTPVASLFRQVVGVSRLEAAPMVRTHSKPTAAQSIPRQRNHACCCVQKRTE